VSEKKTLSNWLTSKYLLIIRSEENLAEKHSFSFNYARVLLVAAGVVTVIFLMSLFVMTVVFEQWLDPRYTQKESRNQLVQMRLSLDSIERQIQARDVYIDNLRLILSGRFSAGQIDSLAQRTMSSEVVFTETLTPIDSQFRAEFENSPLAEVSYEVQSLARELRSIYLFNPVDGVVTADYNPRSGHYGVDIVSKENEPVRAVADGLVILASWTLDGGHVIALQHRGGLVSVYKHNSELTKSVGNFVTGGEIIAIVGNSGELTSGPHLHFELWQNGKPLNPEEYIGL
jgi:murein DD-endopeptidase MepM/ murein hydrolase activator NlpD